MQTPSNKSRACDLDTKGRNIQMQNPSEMWKNTWDGVGGQDLGVGAQYSRQFHKPGLVHHLSMCSVMLLDFMALLTDRWIDGWMDI